jgi:CheY-like chemotaxis protein
VARGAKLPGTDRLLVFDDISEIVSAQRAQAWGEVARRLAHEIKNPLTPIQLSAERLEMKLSGKVPAPEQAILTKSVKTIVDQVDAMKRLVNEFRDYARLPAAELKPLDLNALVTDVLQLYESENAHVPVRMELDAACPPIMGDAQQLRQVVHNLLQNAQDATPRRCHRRPAGQQRGHPHRVERRPAQACACGAGPWHRFSREHPQARVRAVCDHQGQGYRSGPGGGQEDCRRTRLAYRYCEPGRGRQSARRASIVIILRGRRRPDGSLACRLAPQGKGRRIKIMANILVVDDELGIRDLLQEILNDEGHNVEVAENAAQARAARLRDRPDLVLLDIWMPDTDGVTLLKEWSTTGVLTMPVIMMSGHATIDTAVEATKIGALAFLEKPITLQKLLKAVEQGLARTVVRKLQTTPAVARWRPRRCRRSWWKSGRWRAPARHGPAARQSFRPGQAAARSPRRVREGLLRIPPGQGKRLHDPRGRKNRPGAHPPVPQAQAAGRGPVARQRSGNSGLMGLS